MFWTVAIRRVEREREWQRIESGQQKERLIRVHIGERDKVRLCARMPVFVWVSEWKRGKWLIIMTCVALYLQPPRQSSAALLITQLPRRAPICGFASLIFSSSAQLFPTFAWSTARINPPSYPLYISSQAAGCSYARLHCADRHLFTWTKWMFWIL